MIRDPEVPYTLLSLFFSLVVDTRKRNYGIRTVTTEEPAMYNVAIKIERDV
jgi:hypothetical protein